MRSIIIVSSEGTYSMVRLFFVNISEGDSKNTSNFKKSVKSGMSSIPFSLCE